MRFVPSLVVLISTTPLFAQPQALKFAWKPGQILTYAVQQKTTVEEALLNEGTNKLQPGSHVSSMNLTYTWTVTAVDPNGVATLEKTVTAFKSESTRTAPGKDDKPESVTDTLDSSVAEDREKMPFIGKVAVTAKVDAQGRVIEAKSEFGQAAIERFKIELPFRLTLSDKPLSPGVTWERPFSLTLDPKYGGAGEQYPAVQKCTFKGMSGAYAVIGVSSSLKESPPNKSDLRPLIPMLWEGDVFLDHATGRYHACKLVAAKELKDHDGNGTKFSYRSEYVESYQDKK